MATFILVLFIVIIVYFIVVLFNYFGQKRLGDNAVDCYTGAPGAGKTKIGVTKVVKQYRHRLLLWKLGFFDKIEIKKVGKKKKKIKHKAKMPILYSNIPIRFKLPFFIPKKTKYAWSSMLTYEHLTLQDRMVEYSVIFIDELGQIADQYSFDNAFVVQYLQKFIRFCRHYLDPYIVLTDQSSSNIVVHIRRRINVIYNLSNFRRTLIFFYKTDVNQVHITEDMMMVVQPNDKDFSQEYFFGHLPFKWFKKLDISRIFTYKKYDSRCYLPLFKDIEFTTDLKSWSQYFTDYLIDMPNNADMRKQFKKDGYINAVDMLKYLKDWQSQNKN